MKKFERKVITVDSENRIIKEVFENKYEINTSYEGNKKIDTIVLDLFGEFLHNKRIKIKDDNGNIIEDTTYNKEEILSKTIKEYDDNGNCIRVKEYDKNGLLDYEISKIYIENKKIEYRKDILSKYCKKEKYDKISNTEYKYKDNGSLLHIHSESWLDYGTYTSEKSIRDVYYLYNNDDKLSRIIEIKDNKLSAILEKEYKTYDDLNSECNRKYVVLNEKTNELILELAWEDFYKGDILVKTINKYNNDDEIELDIDYISE